MLIRAPLKVLEDSGTSIFCFLFCLMWESRGEQKMLFLSLAAQFLTVFTVLECHDLIYIIWLKVWIPDT